MSARKVRSQRKPSSRKTPVAVPESSLERMIGLLDLFDGGAHCWTVEQMHERFGYTRSTLYRYLKVLSDAELLTSLPEAGYVLGPRIVELDYEIRRHDPLIVASAPVMTELVSEIPGIALLCRRYRDKVLCVHQAANPAVAIQSTYERGKPLPLFSGAASRIILAYLPPHHLQRLYEKHTREFAAGKLGATLTDVRATLKEMRQRGWHSTAGQVTPGITGVAAPIFDGAKNILGSLSLSLSDRTIDPSRLSMISDRVSFCARIISQSMVGVRPR
jgi:DNA-binding IclR family transcriptional regulator